MITQSIWNQDVVNNVIALSTALLISPHQSGQYYGSQGTIEDTQQAINADRLVALPITVPSTGSYDRINVACAVTAGGSVRMGIYSDNNGLPGALVLAANAHVLTASNINDETIVQSLDGPAKYWLASVFSAGSTMSCVKGAGLLPSPGAGAVASAVHRAFPYAALPNPFGGTPSYSSTQVPRVLLRKA